MFRPSGIFNTSAPPAGSTSLPAKTETPRCSPSSLSRQAMQDVLTWLYAAVQPLYGHPVLTYQDVSLVLSVFKDLRVRTELFHNVLLLKLYTDPAPSADNETRLLPASSPPIVVNVHLPTNYPQSPPIVTLAPVDSKTYTLLTNAHLTPAGTFTHPLLDAWIYTHAHVTSNDGIPPRENRLLILFYTIHTLISEHPSIWVERIPSLPPKPSVATLSEKPSQEGSPVAPPQEMSKYGASSTASPLPPQLPPNPIRQALVKEASERFNAELVALLQGTSQYSPLPKVTTIIENQRKLVNSYDTFTRTVHSVDSIENNLRGNTVVVDTKTSEATSLIDRVRAYVDSDYNHEENLLIPLDNKSKQLYHLCFQEASYLDSLHFLELLFNTQKISFTDYIENVRKISRERAKLLIWINKFK